MRCPGFCQVVKNRICYAFNCKKICLGQVVIIVLVQVVTTVAMLGRLAAMTQPASYLTTTSEPLISHVKHSVLVYNQYCKC